MELYCICQALNISSKTLNLLVLSTNGYESIRVEFLSQFFLGMLIQCPDFCRILFPHNYLV